MNKTQQGRSMIEMLGVLAIVGVLSVGGIMAYNMAMNKFKTNKQMDQIQLIMTNVKTLFASNSNYKGLNNGVLVALGVLQAHNQSEANTLSSGGGQVDVDNAFGGQIYVHSNEGAVTAGSKGGTLGAALAYGSYTIAIDRIPRSACAVLLNNDWGGADSGLLDVTVSKGSDADKTAIGGGETIYVDDNGTVSRKNVAQLATMCLANNALYWTIK